MFNFRRFSHEAVAVPEPDASSESVNLLASVSQDVEKTGLFLHVPSQAATRKSKTLPLVKFLLLTAFASAVFFGHPIARFAARAYNTILHCGGPNSRALIPVIHPAPVDSNQTFFPAAEPWLAKKITDRKLWKLVCSSTGTDKDGCNNVVDDNPKTDWKSATSPGSTHWIIIDLGEKYDVHSLQVVSSTKYRRAGGPRNHKVEVGLTPGDMHVVAYGAWRDLGGEFEAAIFEPRPARYIKLTVFDTHENANNKGFVAINEVNVWKMDGAPKPIPGGGRWTDTVNFPLVPVTAWLNPKTGKLVTVSSSSPSGFDKDQSPTQTILSEWDPATLRATEEVVAKTDHNVFCPGTSMDENGQIFFTGGSSSKIYSIYNLKDGWIKPQNNTIAQPRGYQGQTYLSDGRTFMIGGTWSGGDEDKHGEIYDPSINPSKQQWTSLPDISAKYIKMNESRCDPASGSTDIECVKKEWQQHHPWLFAWKDGTVFHAGPSRQMNWFFLTKGSEKVVGAKSRLNDDDAVCGAAVMYDAAAGSILTAGGAPNYHYWVKEDNRRRGHRFPATKNVHGITLGAPGHPVKTVKLASMNHARIFGNAVILPTGEIFIAGGQTKGEGFLDEECVLTPEIYNPVKGAWREATPNSIPRTYHSWALLLPDATVLVGGGGLDSGRDRTNHYDAQVYQPWYLVNGGERPTIVGQKVIDEYKLGTKISIHTEKEVDLDASLIRYSAVTHSLNNDLRRIHLKLEAKGKGPGGGFLYAADIPGDPGVALPGYWMLFVLKGNVPSVAKTVRLHK
ncbi:hypothetical protein QBC34DRAFT_296063 [Podospora aff. communis PSN243]|uniref:F5/8 type C domain-containing protein n=1 Tax=Podospora aff. communis PSN243 TaxID=3040156 RepID=A0AAV9GTP2_9PEZI|nr:hypothetical protein QBC34DRAFT_296063 [Podospora aff. communis PSN243]